MHWIAIMSLYITQWQSAKFNCFCIQHCLQTSGISYHLISNVKWILCNHGKEQSSSWGDWPRIYSLEWSQWSKVDMQFKIWMSGVCTSHIHLKFIWLTTSTHQSPALEANSSPDFRNLKLLHHVHRSPPPVPVLNKTSPIYALPSCLLQILLVLSSHLYLVIPRDLYFKFPLQYTVCISLLLIASSFDFITQ